MNTVAAPVPPATGPDAPLPLFVYGTLRPGEGNYRRMLAREVLDVWPATLPGHALYGRGLPFPYAVPAAGRAVRGAVVVLRRAGYATVLAALDALEGYRPGAPPASQHYRRIRVEVVPDGIGYVWTVWSYLAGPAAAGRLTPAQLIPDGDWFSVARRRARV